MSHFTSIKIEGKLTNQACLVAALEQLGIQNIQSHKTPVRLRDYYEIIGGSPRSSNQAEIVIPYEKNGLSSDAGFQRLEEEFQLVADSMDRQKLQQRFSILESVYQKILIEQQIANIKAQAKAMAGTKGTPIIEDSTVDGKRVVRIAYKSEITQSRQQLAQQRY